MFEHQCAENDLYADFDTRKLFSHSSAEGGKFLFTHLKSEFTYKRDL